MLYLGDTPPSITLPLAALGADRTGMPPARPTRRPCTPFFQQAAGAVTHAKDEPFPRDWFRREDESDDRRFYVTPRLVVHVDDDAIAAIQAYLGGVLPPRGVVLDLMSSWRSHLPPGYARGTVVGLGLNALEMAENPALDERVVHDVNRDPRLPFPDGRFHACVVTVSVQYLTRPVEVFREVARVLAPGATFHVVFSDRMFPTKAVAIWRALGADARQRAVLISGYFQRAGAFGEPEFVDASPRRPYDCDPVYVVHATTLTG